MQENILKKIEKSRKKCYFFFFKSVGDALGVFLDQQRLQKKLYRVGYDQKCFFSELTGNHPNRFPRV